MLCARRGSNGRSFWSPRTTRPVDHSGIAAAGRISQVLSLWVSIYKIEETKTRPMAHLPLQQRDVRKIDSFCKGSRFDCKAKKSQAITPATTESSDFADAEIIGWFAVPRFRLIDVNYGNTGSQTTTRCSW